MDEESSILTLAEVKELLEKQSKKMEFSQEQNLAMQHAIRFARLSASDSRKLLKDLKAIPKVNEGAAAKLTELLPTHPDDVRTVFAKERFTLDPKEIEAILEAVRKYL